ncbi:type IV toxin-antitoxin system YeeU family antitoxin [Shewanella sp. NIFS-20-20]|uniref:type IV toxin-antitoxin system YeeU family antitoxin n=1 Tax=Shewanella sp. NIFS-20-20 TaxID=2853806 RepID=UPI001C43E811|nr:type IV toxin-antitoxin system YeeU family antitoxin [Shewanella sp. NIFS-20-20]MBV7315423.1 type IV toxin-antitoxin system YeeU family antitoxin [Shewanella sp. NIFS-20-20]
MTTIQSSLPYQWGLQRNITPRFGARLILQGSRLDFLWDRSGFVGNFPPEQGQLLNDAFPEIIKQLENQVSLGHLDARQQRSITLQHASFTCEADTLGSHGYLYIAIYPTTAKH